MFISYKLVFLLLNVFKIWGFINNIINNFIFWKYKLIVFIFDLEKYVCNKKYLINF